MDLTTNARKQERNASMHRKLKATGVALMAALALMAVSASSASAQFTSNKEHTIYSGAQTESLKFTAGSGFAAVVCPSATFAGTAAGVSAHTQVIQPTFGSCEDSLGRKVHIESSLAYTFRSGATEGETKGNVDVAGSATQKITNGGGSVVCTVTTVIPQTDNGISYKNLGETKGVEITTNSNNIKSTIEGGFFNCGTATTSATTGTYVGKAVVTGKDTAGTSAAIQVD